MSKKQVKYPPLQLIEEHRLAIREFERARALKTINSVEEEISIAVDYALNKIYEINGIKSGQEVTKVQENTILYQTCDYAIATLIASYWSKCKQVYSFSREFYEMLLDMDDFEIGWSLFDYLPYESFYLEIAGHEGIDGVLVKYAKEPTRCILYTICGRDGKTHTINSGIVNSNDNDTYKSFFEAETDYFNVDISHPNVVMLRQVLSFVLQACMYLCAKNADIVENPLQKQIYKPSATIRNKFSEVQKWDVGIRVVRDHNAAKNALETPKTSEIDTIRKRPRQHWRKAHWHTYWVGPKEERSKVVKFIAPILVNDTDSDMPVVIHH